MISTSLRRRFLALGLLVAPIAALVIGSCGGEPDTNGPSGPSGTNGTNGANDEPADLGQGGLDASDALADDGAIAAPEIPADAPTVLVLSDSIGAGLHLAEQQAFPAVLQRRLAEDAPFHLINASESGRTTAGGAGALDWTLRSEPDVVIVALGGNDGLRGVEIADVERNLRTLIERPREAGAKVLLLGVRLPTNYGDYGAAFDAMYPRLAAEYGVAFVPFYMEGVGGVPEMNLADGLHPSPEGHERLAENVEAALRSVLGSLAASDG